MIKCCNQRKDSMFTQTASVNPILNEPQQQIASIHVYFHVHGSHLTFPGSARYVNGNIKIILVMSPHTVESLLCQFVHAHELLSFRKKRLLVRCKNTQTSGRDKYVLFLKIYIILESI